MADAKPTPLPHRVQDLTGNRYGMLTVLSFSSLNKQGAKWVCLCDCGTTRVYAASTIKRLLATSCGCKRRTGRKKYVKSPERVSYALMKNRCYYKKQPGYERYGGRGIKVCDRWLNGENGMTGVECFLADMGKKPTPKHTLDRYPDKDGNYEPGNCRWATPKEQSWNRDITVLIEIDGVTRSAAEWSRITGCDHATIIRRHRNGLTQGDVVKVTEPKLRFAEIGGVKKTLKEWSRETGIKYGTLRFRMKNGWPADQLLDPTGSHPYRRPSLRKGV